MLDEEVTCDCERDIVAAIVVEECEVSNWTDKVDVERGMSETDKDPCGSNASQRHQERVFKGLSPLIP